MLEFLYLKNDRTFNDLVTYEIVLFNFKGIEKYCI